MCYNEILNFFGEIPNLEKEETEKACFTVFYKIELWKFEKVFNDNILSVNDNVSRIRKKPSLIVQIVYQKFISKPSMEALTFGSNFGTVKYVECASAKTKLFKKLSFRLLRLFRNIIKSNAHFQSLL